MSVEGFRNHVTTDGSLLGVSVRWSACGWSVVQLDHDEELGPMHGMHGTLAAELGVQSTIKRAELTAFLRFLLWSGDMKCFGPKAKDAELWFLIWEPLQGVHQEDILDTSKHTPLKEMQQMWLFEKFTNEGNEKADE